MALSRSSKPFRFFLLSLPLQAVRVDKQRRDLLKKSSQTSKGLHESLFYVIVE
jgi:hypothetical protein